LHLGVFVAVSASWFLFGGLFLFHKKPPKAPESKRDRVSLVGIVLQGIAYALVWSFRRPWSVALFPMPVPLQVALAAFTVGLAGASVWIVSAAVRTLGKQWAFAARLVEEHKLITEGPYGFVRNPIYTGMLGMLVATGLAVSHWVGLLAALVLFNIGTAIRVRSEEKLLRGAFGTEFEAYARRVPAVFPRLY
jgi:protein-S-isoprenylcysteine O-methyltransferase